MIPPSASPCCSACTCTQQAACGARTPFVTLAAGTTTFIIHVRMVRSFNCLSLYNN